MGASVSCTIAMERQAAFDIFVEELSSALAARGIRFNTGPNGSLAMDRPEIARVTTWETGRKIVLKWEAPDWRKNGGATNVHILFEPENEKTRVTLENSSWERLFDDQGSELAGWFAEEVGAPFLHVISPSRFGDWMTDRAATSSDQMNSTSLGLIPLTTITTATRINA